MYSIRGNPACNCGPAVVVPPTASPGTNTSKKKSNTGVIAAVVGGILGVVLVGCLLGVFIWKKEKTKADKLSALPTNQFSHGSGGTNGNAAMVDGSVQGAKPYSLPEITAATQNFNKKIGEGGFGPVYYGKLAGGKEVAVKVSDANSRQGVNEFNNEVLQQLHSFLVFFPTSQSSCMYVSSVQQQV